MRPISTVTNMPLWVSRASAAIDLVRDGIADRMTIIGRITAGDCTLDEAQRSGIAGVRVMLEDGSFAITDADGRYHFEGVVPGTHVVQVSRMTLPEGAQMVDCSASTRNAGSAWSRFAIGQGGSLVVADFHVVLPADAAPVAATAADPSVKSNGDALLSAAASGAVTVTHFAVYSASTAGTQRTDWQALDSPRTLASGDKVEWAIGALDITLT
jgi:hypothetical protein